MFKEIYKFPKEKLVSSYLSINEFAEMIFKILKKSRHKIYNISNPNNYRNSHQIINFFQKKFNIKIKNLPKTKIKIKKSIINSKLFEKNFNFKFSNTLEDDFLKLF